MELSKDVIRFQIITLFPEMIHQACPFGVVGQALKNQKICVETINPRDFVQDVHQTVDDRPFGGGDGMVMLGEPLLSAVRTAEAKALAPGTKRIRKIYLSARGRQLTDVIIRDFATYDELILLCGRYGGVDQRLIESAVDDEICIGDFVLSGGEIGALVIIDAVGRLVPGVLGNSASINAESFANGWLEAPQFTRPRVWQGLETPEALLSGNHAKIERWRRIQSLLITAQTRPDLLLKTTPTEPEIREAISALNAMTAAERFVCGLDALDTIRAVLSSHLTRARELREKGVPRQLSNEANQ